MVLFLLGLVIGFSAAFIFLKARKAGNLVIVDDPMDGAFMFLEVKKDVSKIRKNKAVLLNVVDEKHLLK